MANTYPFTGGDRLFAGYLDDTFALSRGPTPPSGKIGGAFQFKQWMDTSTSPPTLRIATAGQAGNGVYNANDWATLGTLNLSTRIFTYQGDWGGDLVVHGALYTDGDAHVDLNLFLNGTYILFGGDSTTTQGPYIQGTINDFNFELGTGIGSFFFSNPGGGILLKIDRNGDTYVTRDLHASSVVATINLNGSALYLSGPDILFGGNTTKTQGPYIEFDINNFRATLGTGNGNYLFTDGGGNMIFRMDSSLDVHGARDIWAANDMHCETLYADVDVHAYSLHLASQYILFSGNNSLTQGPKIQAEATNFYFQIGSGNGDFIFFNAGATTLFRMYGVNGDFQSQGSGHVLQDMYINGLVNVGEGISSGGTVTALNVVATNDVVAEGVFRQHPTGGGSTGARVECLAGSIWDSVSIAVHSDGSLIVSPDGGNHGYVYGPGTFF